MRVTRALRHHNNIQLLPPLFAIYKQSPFTANQAVASGPSHVSDHFELPVVKPGFQTPAWIKNRRHFLKKLSTAARNLALTGDPFFAFDNIAYESAWVPRPPPAAAANHVPHPAIVVPPPGLVSVAPPLAGHVTPPPPPLVPQPRYPLLGQFRLLQFKTPPQHLFDRSPPQSPDSPAADPPDAGSPPCLPSRPSSSGASSVADPAAALGSPTQQYWLRNLPVRPTAPPCA
jgi:hypothetical protein